MFENYPKVRFELPEAYKKIYNEYYKINRTGSSPVSFFSSKMEKWLHKTVAKDLKKATKPIFTLEIGAGTLNHLEYETAQAYDIIEPFTELYENNVNLEKINSIYSSIFEIEGQQKYNRIISIATFEHILDLPETVAKACTLLAGSGSMRVAIPNEGTILWKLAYELSTGLEFKALYNLKYSTIMNYEHVNTAAEVEEILCYFFADVKSKSFGLNKQLALYRFFECSKPNLEKANYHLISKS